MRFAVIEAKLPSLPWVSRLLLALSCTFATPSAATPCDMVFLQAKTIYDLYGKREPRFLGNLHRHTYESTVRLLEIELKRQEILTRMLAGELPPPQSPWQVEEVRYFCSAPGATEPSRCVFEAAEASQVSAAQEVAAANQAYLRSLLGELSQCPVVGTSGTATGPIDGFGLVDGETGTGEIAAAEIGEPETRGQIFWSSENLEKNPEVSQTMRDSLVAIWEEQVRTLFRDFNALNFENGQGLQADAKMVNRGGLNVIYRNGQEVVAFFRPENVHLEVYLEVPFFFRQKLGATAAVKLVLKRTTKGNFSVQEYEQVPSIRTAYDAAELHGTFMQLQALDVQAKEYLDSITTVAKGLEAGSFGKARRRIAVGVWLSLRIAGGVMGYFLGSHLGVPLLSGRIEPGLLNILPSLAALWTAMLTSKLEIDKPIASRLAALMNKDYAESHGILKSMEARRDQLLEFRARVELMRELAKVGGPCNDLLREKMQGLLNQWRAIKGL